MGAGPWCSGAREGGSSRISRDAVGQMQTRQENLGLHLSPLLYLLTQVGVLFSLELSSLFLMLNTFLLSSLSPAVSHTLSSWHLHPGSHLPPVCHLLLSHPPTACHISGLESLCLGLQSCFFLGFLPCFAGAHPCVTFQIR